MNTVTAETVVSHSTPEDKGEAIAQLLEEELRSKLYGQERFCPELVTDLDAILRRAAFDKSLARVTLALEAGANVNSTCPVTGMTPLMQALDRLYGDDTEAQSCVEKLIAAGADVNIKDCSGRTALMEAVRKNFWILMEMLIEAGADLEARDNEGTTALLECCSLLSVERIRNLLNRGADVHAVNFFGNGVFHYSIRWNWCTIPEKEQLELLVSCGANINHRDNEGRTALYLAAFHGHTNVVKALLDLGATPWIPDNEGVLPVQVAEYQSTARVIASRMRRSLHFIEHYSREQRMARNL